MNAYFDKKNENANRKVAHTISQKQRSNAPAFQFVYNRPENIAQRKMRRLDNNNTRLVQLRAIQEMINNARQPDQNRFVSSLVQRKVVPDALIAHRYRIEGESAEEGPYEILANSGFDHRIVGLRYNNGGVFYYDNETDSYVAYPAFFAYQQILQAGGGNDSIADQMYPLFQAMAHADAKAYILWVASQPSLRRRFAANHAADLDHAHAQQIAVAWQHREDLYQNAGAVDAALAIAHINYDPTLLRRIIDAREPQNNANLMIILNWGFYANFHNMEQIVGHVKIQNLAQLLRWLANAGINNGLSLYNNILQNVKIEQGADLDYLLTIPGGGARYNQPQILQWLGRPWASRAAGNKVQVNGQVPLGQVPGVGGTPNQKYSPDIGSGAYAVAGTPNKIYHLSMSFVIQGPLAARVARFTGFHVSWRTAGAADLPANPRIWFTVNNGLVAFNNRSGAFPGGVLGNAMEMEGRNLMNNYLTRLNCFI